MKKTILFLMMIVMLTIQSCTSTNDFNLGKQQLEQQGYVDIVRTRHQFFCCDEKDTFSTGFVCKDKSGNTVKGCFCSHLLKGVTIRFN